MTKLVFQIATILNGVAVLYAIFLASRRKALAAWFCLIGGMLSMFTWRLVNLFAIEVPPAFNPFIAIWGSSCLFASMFFWGREVSQRQKVEAERDRLLDSERAARADAERASRSKDEFLATVSHELRTPLTAILGWCDLLRANVPQSPVDREASDLPEAIDTIERNARMQSRLIEDLLDVTRIDAGKLAIDRKPVRWSDAIQAAIETTRPAATSKSIQLAADLDEQVIVVGDTVRLQQIALNLLSNAVKFTPTGASIDLRLRRSGPNAELAVIDTGEGIASSFLPEVFGRFRQYDGGASRKHGGLGLGLSIVRRLVELHGGTVEAFSAGLGHGATFTVRVPILEVDSSAVNQQWSGAISGDRHPLEGVRVLLVEDEADVRGVVMGMLQQAGGSVSAVGNASDAFEALAAGTFDALISDIGLPGEDGYSLLRRVRTRLANPIRAIPAIALTAYTRDSDQQHARDAGFDTHVAKPIDASRLIEVVASLAQKRASSTPGVVTVA